MDYFKQIDLARQLGITWIPNTIEGLEFAIEFFKPKATKQEDHMFGYDRKCINCGIDMRNVMLIPYKERKDSCKCFQYILSVCNCDINQYIQRRYGFR